MKGFTYLFVETEERREKEERNIDQFPLTHPLLGT